MATDRHKAIADMMNGLCTDRTFSANEVAIIEQTVRYESLERSARGIRLQTKTREGKELLNNKIAAMINSYLKPRIPLTGPHISLYKKCRLEEYTERTGKCPWGFPEMRKRLGYDPKTGMSLFCTFDE